MVYWEFKGRELVNCNCEYGCNCQFNALPDKGHCHAVVAVQIDEGRYGDTRLDGLRMVELLKWPGPIHEGNGEGLAIIDERADEQQREALISIMRGEDTDPFATMLAVYASTLATRHEPVSARIEFEVDVEGRSGHLSVPGYVEMSGEPIRNKATGEISRIQIVRPEACFEAVVAEVGSASSRTTGGPMQLEFHDSYGQLANLHLSSHGVVRA
jgi:hypothetical protein